MVDPLFNGRICVRKPRTKEEWLELVKKLEGGEVDDLPTSASVQLCKVLKITPEQLFKIFEERSG